eukprot:TRINITY_DN799_c0_g1_i1.p1 TRINITY_DN799_c0_g1~~TRINITY_DN799_c0_g1_i1.p1  ORF type:complete len:163 (-),score=29.19 TRINITY_DN799_c0_g1_i1:491-979(-)
MGFLAFLGRVLFAAVFVFGAIQKIQDFRTDGGLAAEAMAPKIEAFRAHFKANLNSELPRIENTHLLMGAIALEGLGGLLFVLGGSLAVLGAYLLLIFLAMVTPVMHDFYNYAPSDPHFIVEFDRFAKNLSIFGALLFFLGMRSSALRSMARKNKILPKTKSS